MHGTLPRVREQTAAATEDRFLTRREELENKMAVLLGGRAAAHIIYGHLSTGAADDLVKVKDIARSMMMRYGMEVKVGNLSYQLDPSPFLPTSAAPRPSADTAKRPPRRSTGRCARSRVERSSMPSPARKQYETAGLRLTRQLCVPLLRRTRNVAPLDLAKLRAFTSSGRECTGPFSWRRRRIPRDGAAYATARCHGRLF